MSQHTLTYLFLQPGLVEVFKPPRADDHRLALSRVPHDVVLLVAIERTPQGPVTLPRRSENKVALREHLVQALLVRFCMCSVPSRLWQENPHLQRVKENFIKS